MSKHKETTNEEVTQAVIEGEVKTHKKSTKSTSAESNQFFAQIDDYLHDFLVERAPELPENVKETFVKFMPIINMIMIFTAVYMTLISLLYSSIILRIPVLSSGIFGYGYLGQASALSMGLNLAVYGLVIYLLVKAQVGLQPKTKSAWKYLVYAQLINTAIAVLSFSLVWLVGNLITLYVLYQIKSYYKK
jgi:hypothetical protein